MIDVRIVLTVIICLTFIEIIAMFLGINGTFRTIVVAVIAALGGVMIPQPKLKN